MEKEMKGGKRREVKEGKKQDSRSTRYAGYVRRGGGGQRRDLRIFRARWAAASDLPRGQRDRL